MNIKHIGYDDVYGRTSGAFGESNVYAAYISLFLPLTVSFLVTAKNLYYIIFMYLNIFLGIYALVLTGSRGGFLSAIISFIIFFVITRKNMHFTKKFANFYIFSMILISIFIVFKTTPALTVSGIQNNIILRYETSNLNDYSSGRIDLWKKGLEIFLDDPFFGVQKPFSEIVGSNTHNTYLEILVSRGIVGLVLFIAFFYFIFKKVYGKYIDLGNSIIFPAYIAGFCSFIVSMFFLNMFSSYYFFFIYSALALKNE
jgi:O-antigen ligase